MTTVVRTSTINAQGTARASRRPPISSTNEPAVIATDHQLRVGSPVISWATFSPNSPPESMLTPSILATWETKMSRASPPTKPTRIGLDKKLARNPSLKTENKTKKTPHRIAWARASVT